jgi:hypothetical protein
LSVKKIPEALAQPTAGSSSSWAFGPPVRHGKK